MIEIVFDAVSVMPGFKPRQVHGGAARRTLIVLPRQASMIVLSEPDGHKIPYPGAQIVPAFLCEHFPEFV